mgnify:CR=1 FL=1
MQALKVIAIVVCAALLSAALTGVALLAARGAKTDIAQSQLDAFYTPPLVLPDPGKVIRTEPMDLSTPGGHAIRMLYSSSRADGSPAASGAMVFVPDRPAPVRGRPIVAWAHGTVGQGDACAPSRSANPTSQLTPWLSTMLDLGWIVVATDYTGLGTPGTELYLVGEQEARDVVTSVQAARTLLDANAGTTWSVFGHSQGGHSALWTGELASKLAPELHLVGVAAAAPAAELAQIVELQWDELAGWVIGVEVTRSWQEAYPGLPIEGILTAPASENYERLAQECVIDATAESFARFNLFKQDFFTSNPLQVPRWSQIVNKETPAPLPADVPVFLAQGTLDTVVYPEPNANLFTSWCAAGSTITPLFLATDHLQIAKLAAPAVITWLAHRFNGEKDSTNCHLETPVGVVNQRSS